MDENSFNVFTLDGNGVYMFQCSRYCKYDIVNSPYSKTQRTLQNFHCQTGNEKNNIPKAAPIINGDLAEPDEFKYIVAISKKGLWPHGAGTIIDKYWILTARHVVLEKYIDWKTGFFNFSTGPPIRVWPKYSNDLREFFNKPPYYAAKLFCHHIPDDNPVWDTDSDVALVKLQSPIELDQNPYYHQKIARYDRDMATDYSSGYDIRVAGWGRIEPNISGPTDFLRKMKIRNRSRMFHRIIDVRDYPDYRPLQQINLFKPNQSTCLGDSGGPVVVAVSKTGEEFLIGIISWVAHPFCQ